ncbi:unnamed protein product [Phytophthora lilii]|uniref:Unnamed protein product n=1 Tax=Phytophthora lilii TaxID=2077276 RepID=A0A9W7CT61_9STRA|nr:unnamed protein product [Phytophthora lilii]
MQRTNRLLLDELEHSRRMTKSQGESVLNLQEQVEAARQQKRKLEEEYAAKLRRFKEESQQQMELDQRVRESYQTAYGRLVEDWKSDQTGLVEQNERFREEIAGLRR